MKQFDRLLKAYLARRSYSQVTAITLSISGSSFHRLNKRIEDELNITLKRDKRGCGSGFYYFYSMKQEDIEYIKESIKVA